MLLLAYKLYFSLNLDETRYIDSIRGVFPTKRGKFSAVWMRFSKLISIVDAVL